MRAIEILFPVMALVAWTGVVLMMIPVARFRSAFRREVTVDDFKYGESAAVPQKVCLPNRNYMNLLEAPMLFYVAGILLYVTAATSPAALALAWTYVALRVMHSIIHLTSNRVTHRLTVFALSNVALVTLWIVTGIHIASIP